jgi:8-oxo-dGTP diphosphatase
MGIFGMILMLESWRKYLHEAIEMDKKEVSKVMIIDDGKVLLLLRSKNSHWKPLYWDFPGGHLKNDENWVEGAVRETKEETDLDISDLQEITVDNIEKRLKFFKTSNFSGEITLDTVENEDYMWLKVEDVSNYDRLTPNVKKFIKKEFASEDN